jgi:predicted outer membrane protein
MADESKSDSKTKARSNLSENDKKFVKNAYRGGMEEVENGKMAKEKAKNDATKEVAERMINDYTKANEELMSIAKRKVSISRRFIPRR